MLIIPPFSLRLNVPVAFQRFDHYFWGGGQKAVILCVSILSCSTQNDTLIMFLDYYKPYTL